MNTKKIILLYLPLVLCIVFICLFTYFALLPNHQESVPEYRIFNGTPIKDTFDFQSSLSKTNSQDLAIIFPYKKYIQTGRYKDLQALKNDLGALDLLYPQNAKGTKNMEVMYAAITDSLANTIKLKYETYNPDELISLLQWAESFKYIPLYDAKYELFFSAVSMYWLNFISNRLTNYALNNPDIKYDFKFKYVKAKLLEKTYIPPIKIKSFEKFVHNLTENNWAHLYQATWNQTSILQKFIFGLFFVFTPICYIIAGLVLIRKFKDRNK